MFPSAESNRDLVDDFGFFNKLLQDYIYDLPNRDLATLEEVKSSLKSYQINRLDHSLQTTLFEERGGANIKLIFAALIHDVGNVLAPENNSQVSATIIQPLSLEEITWILQMHGLLQMYYYVDKLSLEKDGKHIYSVRKLLNAAVKFYQKWNQLPFDPECQKRN